MKKVKKIFSIFSKSMKIRLFLLCLAIGIIPVLIIGYFINIHVETAMVESKKERLMGQCNILANQVVSEGYMETIKSDKIDAELSQLTGMYDGRVLLINTSFQIVKDTYVMDENKTCVSSDVIKCYRDGNLSMYSKEDSYIEIVLQLIDGNKQKQGVMFVTFSTKDIEDSLEQIKLKIVVAQSILYVIVIIIAVFAGFSFSKPFKKIAVSIDKISEGYFDQKLSLDGYRETERVAVAFNKVLERMKKIDDSRQEFVSNVSHELKTPITSIKVLGDSLMMMDEVPNEIYKEFFEDIISEVDRENDIINDLLTLVRMDKKTTELNLEEVNINQLVEIILKRLRPIAATRNIEVVLESFRPIMAYVDEIKITSAISNLVENAIKYNVVDGWVRVSLNADHKYFFVKVSDSGIGIPKEAQEMVFERFYRVDKTRSRQTGGTGLGLAITKNIILLHNGAIKVHSRENEGTTFTMRIPLVQPAVKTVVDEENIADTKHKGGGRIKNRRFKGGAAK